MTENQDTDTSSHYDPSAELAERIEEALDARGIHQRGDLGFDAVVSAVESDAFHWAADQVPAYYDRNHPDNDTAYLRVYEVALDMSDERLSELVAGWDRMWTFYAQIEPEEYIFCDSCGDSGGGTLEMDAEDGKITVSHRFGCYGGDGLNGASPEEVLEFLRNMLHRGLDDSERKTVEGIIEGFEKVMDRPYLQP